MTGAEICSQNKMKRSAFINPLDASPNTPRHTYDVLNYKLNLDIYNCFKTSVRNFTGAEQITFRVDSTLNSIQLNTVYTSIGIDSVRLLGGVSLVFAHSSTTNMLTINPRSYIQSRGDS